MTYEQLKTKLYKNLTELMRLCDEWKCDKWRVIHYQDYITKTLNKYLQQQWK
jgi:hypothetical protein